MGQGHLGAEVMEKISVSRLSFRRKGSWRNKEKEKIEEELEFNFAKMSYIRCVHIDISICIYLSICQSLFASISVTKSVSLAYTAHCPHCSTGLKC